MSFLEKLSRLISSEEGGDLLLKSLPYESEEVAEAEAHQVSPVSVSNVNLMEGLDSDRAEVSRGVDYHQLEAMTSIPVISAIIQTRVNQVAEFSVPRMEGGDIGFMIRLKDRNESPSDEDQERIQDLYEFMRYCGDKRLASDVGFDGFLRMLTRDSLSYDQTCFEVIRNRKGQVAGFQMVDSSTIRRAKLTDEEKKSGRRNPDGVHYVQVVDDEVVAEFGYHDLCFGIRRPRTNVKYRGYGNPELAEAIPLISNLISAEQYNAGNFTNGIAGKGIIAIKTKMNPKLFSRFRQSFYGMMNGSSNAGKTALLQLDPDFKEEVQNIPLGNNNRDMEFESWHRWQIKMICSIYQIDPAEIGLKMGSEGVTSTLSEGSGLDRVLMSKDKGLRPLLRAIQSWLNEYVISEIDERFELVFTGLDQVDQEAQLKIDKMKVSSYMTLNELRASKDLPPLEGGDVILSQEYLKALELKGGFISESQKSLVADYMLGEYDVADITGGEGDE